MVLDRAGDSAQLHHGAPNETIRALLSLHNIFSRDLCSALFRDPISDSDDGWLRVALQCDVAVAKGVDELHNPFNCPKLLKRLSSELHCP